MTLMQLAAALTLIVGLLVVIGWGVFRIFRLVRFVASVVANEFAMDDEDADHEPVSQAKDAEGTAGDGTRPMGFGVRLRERN